MSSFSSISEAMKAMNETNSSTPLLSEDEILKTIRTSSTIVKPHNNLLKYTILSLSLAAASVATVLLLPRQNESDAVRHTSDTKQSLVPADVSSAPDDVKPTSNSAETPDRTDVQSPPVNQSISLSNEELHKLDLMQRSSSIVYADQGFRITIKTNGISVRGSHDATSNLLPRHVTLYRNGVAFASWFHEREAFDMNNLVAIRVHLADDANTMFPSADVLLWYQPTDELLHSLPTIVRQNLIKELNTATTRETDYIVHQTQNAIITRSGVFPNPVSGSSATVSIDVAENCVTSAALYDAMGNRLGDLWTDMSHRAGSVNIPITNLEDFANGMYIVVITVNGNSKQVAQRLLIER